MERSWQGSVSGFDQSLTAGAVLRAAGGDDGACRRSEGAASPATGHVTARSARGAVAVAPLRPLVDFAAIASNSGSVVAGLLGTMWTTRKPRLWSSARSSLMPRAVDI